MKKRFLGIIFILYSSIITYVLLSNKLRFYLAPQNQIYIKLTIIPLFIMGIVILVNDMHYKFKVSDLILLLPLIFLVLSGNARLSASFAKNRIIKNKDNRIKSNSNYEKKEEDNITYDFSKPYFDINDSSYLELSSYLTYSPKADRFIGKTIRVKGFALTKAEFLKEGYFAIGKYAITCCAADAGFTGFMIKNSKNKITTNNWYQVEGVLEKGKDNEGYDVMYIKIINIKEIDHKEEEQYVYPCYAYDNDACEALGKYNLEE